MSTTDVRQSPWRAVVAATALNLPFGSLYAFSVFLAPLETLLGLSRADLALVFDIGGGSSELIWLDLRNKRRSTGSRIDRLEMQDCIAAWTSLPVGVVTLAERYGGREVDAAVFDSMVRHVSSLLKPCEAARVLRNNMERLNSHLLGTSGTVTTVAGVHLALPRYDRRLVDGCWLDVAQAREVTSRLLSLNYEQRIAQPCIGAERAEFVLAGWQMKFGRPKPPATGERLGTEAGRRPGLSAICG